MPLPAWAGALINSGTQLAGGLLSNIWQTTQQSGQREHGYQMTDYLYGKDLEQWNRQNELNLENWNLQNAYNSPKEQMQRFRDAGLNPNLMYSQGQPGLAQQVQMSPGVSASGSPQNTARMKMPPLDVMGQIYNFKLQDQQIKNLETLREHEIEKKKVTIADGIIRALEANIKPEMIGYTIDEQNQNRKMWPGNYQAQQKGLTKTEAEIKEIAAKMDLTKAEKEKLQIWLDNWNQHGIDINKAPYWLQKLLWEWNKSKSSEGGHMYGPAPKGSLPSHIGINEKFQ